MLACNWITELSFTKRTIWQLESVFVWVCRCTGEWWQWWPQIYLLMSSMMNLKRCRSFMLPSLWSWAINWSLSNVMTWTNSSLGELLPILWVSTFSLCTTWNTSDMIHVLYQDGIMTDKSRCCTGFGYDWVYWWLILNLCFELLLIFTVLLILWVSCALFGF